MCTLSVIRTREDAVRLAFNRDELRTRAAAQPPRIATIGDCRVMMPIDPDSGGTWIAATETGLVLALLNVNPLLAVRPGPVSRGRIIPRLASCADLGQLQRALLLLRVTENAPFRLLGFDRDEYIDARSDGRDLQLSRNPFDREPLMFTSSGLGDHLVDPPRRELFNKLVVIEQPTATAQDQFHRHRWPDRQHLSVCMSRPDACAVSHTVVELHPNRVTMIYRSAAPEPTVGTSTLTLNLLKRVTR